MTHLRRGSLPAPNREQVVLKEVRGGADVRGNHAIAQSNAVHLHGEQHRNAATLQFTSRLHHGCASPALPVQDHSCGLSFVVVDATCTKLELETVTSCSS